MRLINTQIVLLLVLLLSCSSDDKVLSGENKILSFGIRVNGEIIPGDIDEEEGIITLSLVGANVTGLIPVIQISPKATVSPASESILNFGVPLTFVVTAENGDTKSYIVSVENRPFSNEKLITEFSVLVDGQVLEAEIDQQSSLISLELVNTDLSALTPDISVSEYATVNPPSGVAQDFNSEVTYEVTAENGTTNSYAVNITSRPLSSEKEMLSFSVLIDGTSYDAMIFDQEVLLNIGSQEPGLFVPTIEVSEFATISPNPDAPQDFSEPVVYTVIAEDGSELDYTVYTNKPVFFSLYPTIYGQRKFYTNAEFSIGGVFINPEATDAELFLSDGSNEFPLEVISFEEFDNDNSLAYDIGLKIPDGTPEFSSYTLVYRNEASTLEYDQTLDIAPGGPLDMQLNQNNYSFNDVMVLTGTNLLPALLVPSNGSLFLVENSNNYDISLNEDRTELTWTLNYYQHFPSYYGDAPELKRIFTMDEEGRVGAPVFATFN